MSQALLGLSRLTIIEKIARIRAITKATATNINFKTPEPTLAEIEAAVDLLELDEAATKTTKIDAINSRNLQDVAVMVLMSKFLSYVQTTSEGDAVKIGSILLKVKGASTPSQAQEKVTNVKGKTGDFEGTVKVSWKSLKNKGAKFYQIQFSADGITAWVNHGVNVTTAKATVTGLTSETPGFFRIAAGNTLGLGPWSDVIRIMIK